MRLMIDARKAAIDLVTKNGVGAEVGVHLGEFSSTILALARPQKLYLIDPWKHFPEPTYRQSMYGGERDIQKEMDARYEKVVLKFDREISSGTVKVCRELSVDAALRIGEGELDFVYIDGDHSYQGVSQDLKSFFPKVKKGGLIIGDDYSLGGWWKDGIVRAFNEFVVQSGSIVEFKMDGQFVVRKLS
jgi:Methyltransferase domain